MAVPAVFVDASMGKTLFVPLAETYTNGPGTVTVVVFLAVVPPFLLLRTAEDPLEPIAVVEDRRTADRIRRKHFEKHAVYDDRDWDYVRPILGIDLNTRVTPRAGSRDSWHFFRHSFAEYDLNGWDALRAAALAGKTGFTVKKNLIVFQGDARFPGKPAGLGGAPSKDAGQAQ